MQQPLHLSPETQGGKQSSDLLKATQLVRCKALLPGRSLEHDSPLTPVVGWDRCAWEWLAESVLEIVWHLPLRCSLRLKRRWSLLLWLTGSHPLPFLPQLLVHSQQGTFGAGGRTLYDPFPPDFDWLAIEVSGKATGWLCHGYWVG